MRKLYASLCIAMSCAVLSCHEQEEIKNEIPNEVKSKLEAAGFDTSEGLSKFENGYRVEYDLYFTEDDIANLSPPVKVSETAEEEHYRTTYVVKGTPRTLTVYMDPAFGSYMMSAFNKAIQRYNDLGLTIKFQSTTSTNANIRIIAFYENSNVLGISAGFPTSGGNPASPIRLNTKYYSNTSQRADAATVIAHEIGHAIGFRHTDYFNRAFSCGTGGNEGSAGVGAIHISGTPSGTSSGSWMLACSNGSDRPFTSADRTALTTVY